MELFITAYYTGGYTILKERRQNISPPPTWWCRSFVRNSTDAVNEGISWRPFYDCVDYFVSILPFAYLLDVRNEIKLGDSYIRLADSYYVTSNYQNAINTYDKIVQDYGLPKNINE